MSAGPAGAGRRGRALAARPQHGLGARRRRRRRRRRARRRSRSRARAGALPGTRRAAGRRQRSVDRRFAPFSRLERPFAEEDWGLPAGADLDHQRRAEARRLCWKPRPGASCAADVRPARSRPTATGHAPRAPSGLRRARRRTHALWLDTDGALRGARDSALRAAAACSPTPRVAGRWLAPSLRARARRPSHAGRLGGRCAIAWARSRASSRAARRCAGGCAPGCGERIDRHDDALLAAEQRATTWRAGAESPAGGPLGVALQAQRRAVRDVARRARARSRTSASVAAARRAAAVGALGPLDVELTGEADNRRLRTLTFVGPGAGAYDALGNFVGHGGLRAACSW